MTAEHLALLLIGTWYGMLIGVLPGISGGVGLILMLPVTFGWPLDSVLVFFAAAWGGTSYGGAVTSILLGVPGETSSAVTMIDGYPLSKKGKAAFALGASALATALGASVGILILVGLIPVLREIVLLFGPAEFFAMGLLGVAVIALVSGRHPIKGLVSGCVGLLLGVHGFNPVTGVSRLDLGLPILRDGIPLIPAFVGMFALAQGIHLLMYRPQVTQAGTVIDTSYREILRGMRSVFTNFWLFLRCSVIGTVVGVIPGPGGTVATWLAYAHARQSAKDKSQFGNGDVRGVIAPEAANDAKDGGALVPTLAFGVPGTLTAGIIMLTMQFHGVQPGPSLLGPELGTAFVLILALFMSNWLTSLTGVALGRWSAKVTMVPSRILGPIIIALSVIGAFANRNLIEDVLIMFAFGILGFVFIRADVPPVPLVIGLLLAPVIETSFHQAYQIGDGTLRLFTERPIAAGILLVLLLTFVSISIRKGLRAREERQAERV